VAGHAGSDIKGFTT